LKILKNKTITDVPYFKASGIHCGLRKKEKKDLCVIFSEKKSVAAATFTQNTVKAAPVVLNMEHIKSKNTQAIVVNSGYANACTGAKGIENAKEMAEITAKALNIKTEEVLVSSTGRIGIPIPMEIAIPGIKKACNELSYSGGDDAANAILTTDTFEKKLTISFELDGKEILLSAIAKGSGMVHPNMGTILSFIVTNTNISKEMLTKALKESVQSSYNMISVDGDTSTNDMAIILANGTAGNTLITTEDETYYLFKEALDFLNVELSKAIAKDGEGATKLVEISLLNAKTLQDARVSAKSVICSNLVKSALFGRDANWGRIMCSLGYSGAEFNPCKVNIFFKNEIGTVQVVQRGHGLSFNKDLAEEILKQDYVNICIDLQDGNFNADAWGCDLTYDYVKINGAYRL
jgi:glutamate N-acetyltransferase/amino-acid N-acetyltransferase